MLKSRWAPGFRRGEIVWTELVHPAVRLHKQSAADVPNGGKILWPAVVVDRWVSNPRDSIDPRLAVVKAATADSEDGEFDAVFHPLPTSNPSESGTLNTAPAVTSTSTTATIDLLDTFARYEVKNALKNVADYHGDDEDSGSMEVDEDASSVMDLNASSTNSVIGADEVPSNNSNGNSTTAKRHVVIPFGLPSNRGGRTSTRASRTASPISSSVSDVVSDFSVSS
ncbi:hypothetical protein BCR33DRAFT_110437 [Rhizoclosmatium globosum]|uniref:Uncharacterized protein n=1 Tax=Rhizoclosmatium globosum TaxID=329046 RepID=A0A1Y2CIE3_9FUNG|nr:hypothetical protein BCR33DRAFT_110437 [Rhizoclosmatium globosum]|eukprot:ORY46821.1 hypothetical protein BCR33DRAFT_110437 [Rhizoclosmatium globosum]